MARINWRISRSEQRKKGGLRLLQVKSRLVISVGGDPIEVPVPRFAGIYAEFASRLAEQHVPGALDVLGGERMPVMPMNTLAQVKGQFSAVLVPRPVGGEVRHDRSEGVLRGMLVENDEVVEHRHHWRDGRNRHFFERRHAGRAVAMGNLENASRFLRRCGPNSEAGKEKRSCRRKPSKLLYHSPSLACRCLSSGVEATLTDRNKRSEGAAPFAPPSSGTICRARHLPFASC